MDAQNELLRHTLATLAYRAGKAVRGASDGFAKFRPSESGRTAGQILAHMGDLMEWALSIARGKQTWRDSIPLPWPDETKRFFATLEAFDAFLASGEPLQAKAEKLFQGPIADALTHTGQLAMLRRLAAEPMKGENYFVAGVAIGVVSFDQPPPVREFD